MTDELKIIYGVVGLLLASGVLTWLTKPAYFEPVYPKRRKKHKTKLRLQARSLENSTISPYPLQTDYQSDPDLSDSAPAQPIQDA
jgi:hypothetical protein